MEADAFFLKPECKAFTYKAVMTGHHVRNQDAQENHLVFFDLHSTCLKSTPIELGSYQVNPGTACFAFFGPNDFLFANSAATLSEY